MWSSQLCTTEQGLPDLGVFGAIQHFFHLLNWAAAPSKEQVSSERGAWGHPHLCIKHRFTTRQRNRFWYQAMPVWSLSFYKSCIKETSSLLYDLFFWVWIFLMAVSQHFRFGGLVLCGPLSRMKKSHTQAVYKVLIRYLGRTFPFCHSLRSSMLIF